jgi:hypothetical protein
MGAGVAMSKLGKAVIAVAVAMLIAAAFVIAMKLGEMMR